MGMDVSLSVPFPKAPVGSLASATPGSNDAATNARGHKHAICSSTTIVTFLEINATVVGSATSSPDGSDARARHAFNRCVQVIFWAVGMRAYAPPATASKKERGK